MFDVVGAQMQPTMTQDDRRFHDLARRFTEDRELMLVVEEQGRIVGGTLMFKTTLRAIGLEPAARAQGLGRRLLETLWETATRQGCGGISLGVGRGASAARVLRPHGYPRQSRMGKQLPLSPLLWYSKADDWRQRLEELRHRREERLSGLKTPGAAK